MEASREIEMAVYDTEQATAATPINIKLCCVAIRVRAAIVITSPRIRTNLLPARSAREPNMGARIRDVVLRSIDNTPVADATPNEVCQMETDMPKRILSKRPSVEPITLLLTRILVNPKR